MRAALAARSSWLSQRDRASARTVFEGCRGAKFSWSTTESAEVAAKAIVPAETMNSLLARTNNVCASFAEMFDEQAIGVKYGDDDIDQACQALPASLTRELARIVTLNGTIPAPHLDILYGRAKHIAVNQ